MAQVRKAKTKSGTVVEYVDEIIGSGGMKDVYFTPDRKNAVAFFRDKQDRQAQERLEMITGTYRERIFNQEGGAYWENLFRWPTDMVKNDEGQIGVVVPIYQDHFFFATGSINNDFLNIKGREKEGKWFASPSNRNKYLDPSERGNWLDYLRISILLSRAVRRMHAAGLAHSDLSYKNVLIDPAGGNACIIDIDGLVVPGKFPPDVVGTPDFIAPEVIKTCQLERQDPNRKLPSIYTDRHALAVLIYMYLLLRHPLRGDKVHDIDDPQRDEDLSMGERALFVEHPADLSNKINLDYLKPLEIPWKDTAALPCEVTGPYLNTLFHRAFIEGLHAPEKRPTADEWEQGLVKTVDLLQPCANALCDQQWYVFDNTKSPKCPFCGTKYTGKLPVLNLYSSRHGGKFLPDNHRLMVYTGQSLFSWHVNRNIIPNERLGQQDRQRVGYFIFHNNNWLLVNERLPGLINLSNNQPVPIGGRIILKDNSQILFSKESGGRVALVQLVDA
ncbi:Protein kinase domain-containing protein [Candidatus Electrothrix aarhusensis]|uniref:Protein kinase domain-containing protein n=1 Tax=Candidatus Electrothrix aarhusensis TaxID=1859131 RepID=A0A444IXY0_9BACT|nr:Protein kinase domain-containing protein [Candidatus Electrothrix aarhusensis]